jgi:hypothetical protein
MTAPTIGRADTGQAAEVAAAEVKLKEALAHLERALEGTQPFNNTIYLTKCEVEMGLFRLERARERIAESWEADS